MPTENLMPTFPFELSLDDLNAQMDVCVDTVFSCLQSEFLSLPRGKGFVEYPAFEEAYEALKAASCGFADMTSEKLLPVVASKPVSFIVLRSMLGFTPPEWAYISTQRTDVSVTQGAARGIDRKIRIAPCKELSLAGVTGKRIEALVQTACELLNEGAPAPEADKLHRFDKADTANGLVSLRRLAEMGAPYAILLYERFLGRPFAGHRDSVSELIGDGLESAIEEVLHGAGISFRKTKRAERIDGFDQVPDFIIPSEFSPKVVIEAKITEDDGTARDKVTRIQHLDHLSRDGMPGNRRRFQVIACIGGRGFGVRREDMKKMLLATDGKVFTNQTLDYLVECTDLDAYQSRK